MYAALTKAGVPASFIRINGAGHGFEGAAPADLERANAAMMQWFEQHLGVQPARTRRRLPRDTEAPSSARPKKSASSSGRHGSPNYVTDSLTARCS